MQLNVFELCSRLKAVEREHLIIHEASTWFEAKVRLDSSLLEKVTGAKPPNVTPIHLHAAIEQLEPTFIIRLFAEFEAGLRFYWEKIEAKSSIPKMQDLIDSITSKWKIESELKEAVHSVRTYRNQLIHVGTRNPSQAISINTARSRLCEFISRGESKWS